MAVVHGVPVAATKAQSNKWVKLEPKEATKSKVVQSELLASNAQQQPWVFLHAKLHNVLKLKEQRWGLQLKHCLVKI